jgi:hypothetical protein
MDHQFGSGRPFMTAEWTAAICGFPVAAGWRGSVDDLSYCRIKARRSSICGKKDTEWLPQCRTNI